MRSDDPRKLSRGIAKAAAEVDNAVARWRGVQGECVITEKLQGTHEDVAVVTEAVK